MAGAEKDREEGRETSGAWGSLCTGAEESRGLCACAYVLTTLFGKLGITAFRTRGTWILWVMKDM